MIRRSLVMQIAVSKQRLVLEAIRMEQQEEVQHES